MIPAMTLRLFGWLFVAGLACAGCGSDQPSAKEPRTAKQKQLQEARRSGDVDATSSKWGGWRYEGDRNDCFYVVGRKCFKTQKSACAAAACKAPTACTVEGGGPATVRCAKSS